MTPDIHFVTDFTTGKLIAVQVEVDAHGLVISTTPDNRCLVLDASNGQLRVFLSNENEDIVDGPIATLNTQQEPQPCSATTSVLTDR